MLSVDGLAIGLRPRLRVKPRVPDAFQRVSLATNTRCTTNVCVLIESVHREADDSCLRRARGCFYPCELCYSDQRRLDATAVSARARWTGRIGASTLS